MKDLLTAAILVIAPCISFSQNVGIGTNNPQQKLHVAGNVRVDALSGTSGVLKYNTSGDMEALPVSGVSEQALLGNGNWGVVPGTIPAGTVVATAQMYDSALLSRGFSLYGSLPSFTRYFNITGPTPANSWLSTYTEGNYNKGTPADFDGNNTMFWDDSILIVYTTSGNAFHAYNPVSDKWRLYANNTSSLTASLQAKHVWNGTELIVWGGFFSNGTNNGFRYNPTTNTFRAIAVTNQPVARRQFAMEVVGNKLVIWGGIAIAGGALLNTGGIYDLVSETWVSTSLTGVPEARENFTSVANTNNQTVLIWGGQNTATSLLSNGAILNPVTNTWTAITTTNAPTARELHTGVWTGSEMIVFGGNISSFATQYTNTGSRYNPTTNTWTAISTSGSPSIGAHGASWINNKMFVAGGLPSNVSTNNLAYSETAFFYDPVLNSWSNTGVMPINVLTPICLAANNIVLVFGAAQTVRDPYTGVNMNRPNSNRGGRYLLTSASVSQTLLFSGTIYLYRKN